MNQFVHHTQENKMGSCTILCSYQYLHAQLNEIKFIVNLTIYFHFFYNVTYSIYKLCMKKYNRPLTIKHNDFKKKNW
jgi:hypothetical protein